MSNEKPVTFPNVLEVVQVWVLPIFGGGFLSSQSAAESKVWFLQEVSRGKILRAYMTSKQQPAQESQSTEGEQEMTLHVHCKTYSNFIHSFKTQSLSDLSC